MSKDKVINAAKGGSLPSQLPKSVHVGSAEGYVGRLPGLDPRPAVEITDADLRGLLDRIANGGGDARHDAAPSAA